jgi:curved DNA-binding protein CbpA
VSLGRRLGRLARGFAAGNVNEERLRETLRQGRERSETLRSAFGAAWKGASEEWRAAEERRAAAEERPVGSGSNGRGPGRAATGGGTGTSSGTSFIPRRYPLDVLAAYHRLGLGAGAPLEEVNKRRRELVKRHHPDRFTDPAQRVRAERLTAEINSAHDAIERHLTRGK